MSKKKPTTERLYVWGYEGEKCVGEHLMPVTVALQEVVVDGVSFIIYEAVPYKRAKALQMTVEDV